MSDGVYTILDEYTCRICLEEDDEENFISPCGCSGTSKYVHNTCLNKWRYSIDYNPLQNLDKTRYNTCDVCNSRYNIIDTVHTSSYSTSRLILLGVFDCVILTIILHLGYFIFGFISYKAGLEKSLILSENMYVNMYVNGICIVQTVVLLFYMTRVCTTGWGDQLTCFYCGDMSGDMSSNDEICSILIVGIFLSFIIMSFLFLYVDYVSKKYYQRTLFI